MNILALLSHTDLFGQLSGKSCKRIAEIAVEKTLKKNQTLFLEGDKGSAIYLLTSGNIQLSKSNTGVLGTAYPREPVVDSDPQPYIGHTLNGNQIKIQCIKFADH